MSEQRHVIDPFAAALARGQVEVGVSLDYFDVVDLLPTWDQARAEAFLKANARDIAAAMLAGGMVAVMKLAEGRKQN